MRGDQAQESMMADDKQLPREGGLDVGDSMSEDNVSNDDVGGPMTFGCQRT